MVRHKQWRRGLKFGTWNVRNQYKCWQENIGVLSGKKQGFLPESTPLFSCQHHILWTIGLVQLQQQRELAKV